MGQEAGVARVRGPVVFGGMDQAELDDAYDQRVWAANFEQLSARRQALSAAARARVAPPLRFAYGPSAVEGLDVYVTPRAGAPVLVFIHGGAWRAGAAKDFAYFAAPYTEAGAHLAVLDFANVDQTGGDLMEMVRQVRSAVAWLYRNARQTFGGDANRIFICAHSSGAHLGGNVATTDWARDFDLPRDVVKGAVLFSGMYDLAPVRLSKRSQYVNFTDTMEQALSSQRHLDLLDCPLVIGYGTRETPEFMRQSRDFAAAVEAAGKPVRLVVAPEYNHFELVETFANPYGVAGCEIFAMMGLTAGGALSR